MNTHRKRLEVEQLEERQLPSATEILPVFDADFQRSLEALLEQNANAEAAAIDYTAENAETFGMLHDRVDILETKTSAFTAAFQSQISVAASANQRMQSIHTVLADLEKGQKFSPETLTPLLERFDASLATFEASLKAAETTLQSRSGAVMLTTVGAGGHGIRTMDFAIRSTLDQSFLEIRSHKTDNQVLQLIPMNHPGGTQSMSFRFNYPHGSYSYNEDVEITLYADAAKQQKISEPIRLTFGHWDSNATLRAGTNSLTLREFTASEIAIVADALFSQAHEAAANTLRTDITQAWTTAEEQQRQAAVSMQSVRGTDAENIQSNSENIAAIDDRIAALGGRLAALQGTLGAQNALAGAALDRLADATETWSALKNATNIDPASFAEVENRFTSSLASFEGMLQEIEDMIDSRSTAIILSSTGGGGGGKRALHFAFKSGRDQSFIEIESLQPDNPLKKLLQIDHIGGIQNGSLQFDFPHGSSSRYEEVKVRLYADEAKTQLLGTQLYFGFGHYDGAAAIYDGARILGDSGLSENETATFAEGMFSVDKQIAAAALRADIQKAVNDYSAQNHSILDSLFAQLATAGDAADYTAENESAYADVASKVTAALALFESTKPSMGGADSLAVGLGRYLDDAETALLVLDKAKSIDPAVFQAFADRLSAAVDACVQTLQETKNTLDARSGGIILSSTGGGGGGKRTLNFGFKSGLDYSFIEIESLQPDNAIKQLVRVDHVGGTQNGTLQFAFPHGSSSRYEEVKVRLYADEAKTRQLGPVLYFGFGHYDSSAAIYGGMRSLSEAGGLTAQELEALRTQVDSAEDTHQLGRLIAETGAEAQDKTLLSESFWRDRSPDQLAQLSLSTEIWRDLYRAAVFSIVGEDCSPLDAMADEPESAETGPTYTTHSIDNPALLAQARQWTLELSGITLPGKMSIAQAWHPEIFGENFESSMQKINALALSETGGVWNSDTGAAQRRHIQDYYQMLGIIDKAISVAHEMLQGMTWLAYEDELRLRAGEANPIHWDGGMNHPQKHYLVQVGLNIPFGNDVRDAVRNNFDAMYARVRTIARDDQLFAERNTSMVDRGLDPETYGLTADAIAAIVLHNQNVRNNLQVALVDPVDPPTYATTLYANETSLPDGTLVASTANLQSNGVQVVQLGTITRSRDPIILLQPTAFTFTIQDKSMVNVWLDGNKNGNLTIYGNNLAQAYSSAKGGNSAESISLALTPGTYTVLVNRQTDNLIQTSGPGSFTDAGLSATFHLDVQQRSTKEILGRISIEGRQVAMPVSIRVAEFIRTPDEKWERKPLAETQALNVSKPVWIVIHGMNSNEKSNPIVDVASSIGAYHNMQVVTINWAEAAADGIITQDARWTPAVGKWIANQLIGIGFDPANINIAGWSHGSYVAYAITEQVNAITQGIKQVNSLVALDPAGNWPLLSGFEHTIIDFKKYTKNSIAIEGSYMAGSNLLAKTADVTFRINAPQTETFQISTEHSLPVTTFAEILKNPGAFSDYISLQNIMNPAVRKNDYVENSFEEGYEFYINVAVTEEESETGDYYYAHPLTLHFLRKSDGQESMIIIE